MPPDEGKANRRPPEPPQPPPPPAPWPWAEDDLIRIRHMLDAAEQIGAFTRSRTRDSLLEDEIATLGLVKAIEIIGEAAFALDPSVRDAIDGVPWPQVIGMRHRPVHAYFDVDLAIVWATATKAVPDLSENLQRFLNQWELPPRP